MREIPTAAAALPAPAAASGIRSVVSRQDHKTFRRTRDGLAPHPPPATAWPEK
ncbi:hypothetical protein AB0D24_33450 [Streptomyces javensis]|uniref:hypothetical protein n=1 Tax=Streptomyces javensis TaxID=114698 RepID=UPI0033E563A9